MIYIRHSSMSLLGTIVKLYMHPSMLYKLENRFATSSAEESTISNPLALRSHSELGNVAGQRGIISCANTFGLTGVNFKVYEVPWTTRSPSYGRPRSTTSATNNQVVNLKVSPLRGIQPGVVFKRSSSTTRSTPNKGGSALAVGSYSTFINDVNVKKPNLNPY